VTLDENAQVVLSSFALGAVVANFARACIKHRYCVSANYPIQLFASQAA
jgi:hypothetical protein